jgi:hypothetical protein
MRFPPRTRITNGDRMTTMTDLERKNFQDREVTRAFAK